MSTGGGRPGGGFISTSANFVKWMAGGVLNMVAGIALLLAGVGVITVIVPYAGFMAWHHDDLQLGADKGTAFVIWEYTVVGATFEGGTVAAPVGINKGQELTQNSLGNKSVNP